MKSVSLKANRNVAMHFTGSQSGPLKMVDGKVEG